MSAPDVDPVEAWVEGLYAEALADLRWPELRKGVQALSALYVHGRDKGDLAPRAAEGRGKAAAFRCFFAPLHLLVARALVASLPGPGPGEALPRQLLDLGCGSGAAGAGVGLQLAAWGSAPEVDGVDRVAEHLQHARRTFAALGLRAKLRSGSLPGALGQPGPGQLLVLGWSLNELDPGARAATVAGLRRALDRGAGLLLIEPLSTKISPWWAELAESLAEIGVSEHLFKERIPLPAKLRDMDKSAGLDHQLLGCRALHRWPRAPAA